MKKDKLIPFDPTNPKHLEGFTKSFNKLAKKVARISKNQPRGILIPEKLYKKLKKIGTSNSILSGKVKKVVIKQKL